jgi:phenylacetate-CoA ligase
VVKANGDIDWDRWGEIPIVKRQDMIDHRDAMQATELPPGHGPTAVFHTSGSTGLPIDITSTAIGAIADQGFRWRVHRSHDLDWSKVLVSRLGFASDSEWLGGANPLGPWGPTWDPAGVRGAAWIMDRDLPNGDVMALYQKLDGSYFNSGAASSHIMARDAERLGIDLTIDAILTQGNIVRKTDREICRRVFGARMIETYSSKEGGQLAHECPDGSLHLNAEGSFVEIIYADGRACLPGETGHVVITPIFQTAQPLIRYQQGDMATVGWPCSCGRHSPTLAGVVGRNISVFTRPGGEAKVITYLADSVRELLNCDVLQLAQTGPNSYEVRYEPRNAERESDEAAAALEIRTTLWNDSQITFIHRTPGHRAPDKAVDFVNEWDSDLLGTS